MIKKTKLFTKDMKMKKQLLILAFFLFTFAFQVQADPQSDVTSNVINAPMSSDGYQIGSAASDKVGFYGETPVIQPTDASQAAIVDSSTGTVSNAIAAGVGIENITFPATLSGISDGDVLTDFVPGYKFKVLGVYFVTNDPVVTGSKASTIKMEIGAVPVTGGTLSLTSAGIASMGQIVDGTAITALNTGSSTATLSLVASSTTAFLDGDGSFIVRIQNMDSADAFATISDKWNELRSSLVDLGLIAGE